MSELIILFVILLVWSAWTYANKVTLGDFFSPFNLLFYFWVLPFLLSFLNLSKLQTGLSFEAIGIVIVSTTILVFVSVLPMLVIRRRTLVDSLQRFGSFLNGAEARWLVIGFYAVTLVAMYFAEFREGIPIFEYLSMEADDSALHLAGKDSKLQVVAQGLMVAGMLCFYFGMISRVKTRWFYILLALFVPFLSVLKASKSGVFTPILYYFAIFYYLKVFRRERFAFVKVGFVIIAVVLLLASLTIVRVLGVHDISGFSGQIEFRYANNIFFPLNEIIATIYGYVALGFQNFSNYVDSGQTKLRLGTSLFRPFLSMLMQGDYIREMSVPKSESTWHFVSWGATIGTYLRDLYMEGGVIFCVVGSLLYASLINYLYFKFRKSGRGEWLMAYVVFLFPWTWIFFQNAFSILTFYVNAFYVFTIFLMLNIISRAVQGNRSKPAHNTFQERG